MRIKAPFGQLAERGSHEKNGKLLSNKKASLKFYNFIYVTQGTTGEFQIINTS